MKRMFLPTARQTNWLLCIDFLSVEYAPVSLECQAGLDTWLCGTFRLVIVLYDHSVFGAVALGAALINLMRPSVVMLAIAIAAAGFGIVLHNGALSALAAAFLVLSLARPAAEPE